MGTLALNAAISLWTVLLLAAPAFALALRGRLTAATLAISLILTLVVICLVTYVTALAGFGTIGPLRVCVLILFLVLIWDLLRGIQLVRAVRTGTQSRPVNSDVLALPVGLLVGIWTMAPPLLTLGRLGERFGMIAAGNADLPNYALAATSVAQAGFGNTNHLAGFDMGHFSRTASYMGPTALINFVSAATGLAAWQATLATMAAAVSLTVVALWALIKAVWPAAGTVTAAAVVVASFAALNSYVVGQYFLGGVLAVVSVATALAGATMLARPRVHSQIGGSLALAGGGALGIYSYGHLGLPIVLLLPLWSVLVYRLTGRRTGRELAVLAGWATGSAVLALVLSAIAVPTAWSLVRAQSTSSAGWSMPPLTAEAMLWWPPDVRQPSSPAGVIGSWLVVAVVVVLGIWASWRAGPRDSVVISTVLTVGAVGVALGCMFLYGPDRYQTWKMEAFLLPYVVVVCLPALGALTIRRRQVGLGLLLFTVGLVSLSPALTWQPAASALQNSPADRAAGVWSTSMGLVSLADSPDLTKLSSVNVRLGSWFETMAAASIVPTPVVILSSLSYYTPRTSLATCTLTRIDMLAPGETAYTNLGGGYALLRRPSVCAVRN